MDKLVDHLFVFEGDGVIRDFPGNYSQYRMEKMKTDAESQKSEKPIQGSDIKHSASDIKKKQFSYKEKREFELLEKEIKDLTKEKENITQKLSSGTAPYEELEQASQRIVEVTRLLDRKEFRWLELSELIS